MPVQFACQRSSHANAVLVSRHQKVTSIFRSSEEGVQGLEAHLGEVLQAERPRGVREVEQLHARPRVGALGVPLQRRGLGPKHGVQVARQGVALGRILDCTMP